MNGSRSGLEQLHLGLSLEETRAGGFAPGLLHELFERRARERVRATAVICGESSLSYGELEERANRLARMLRSRGVERGDCVGLLLPRSLEVYVALLGILKAGAAYVPLDPEYPPDRVGYILADCQARVLVTSKCLAAKAQGFGGVMIQLDGDRTALDGQSAERIDPATVGVTPEDLCYVIYTSGTTGRPKGVQIEHRSAHHLVRAEGEIFGVRSEDKVYQGFSIAFDASVEEVWLAFHAGATLVAGTAEMVRSGPALSGRLTQAGVTVLSCVPTLLAMMEDDVPGLRLLILGGEVCPPDLVRRWWKPGRRVVNTYGPTEATVIATYGDCQPGKPVTIGRPLPNYSALILDEQLQPVGAGMAGELCLGGVGLARGYVGKPELTREKFVWLTGEARGERAEGNAARYYRTGDLARWTPEGEIEFLGRIDTQVKIRGFRVELSEIESVIMEWPRVKAAAVTLREDTPGVRQLAAYVVPRGDGEIEETGLRALLRGRLPAFMMPAVIEVLRELPTLPSGKVDRKRLPTPRAGQTPRRAIARPPQGPIQERIAESWEKLFATGPISASDDFFLDLGGHSLLAARMVSELRKVPPFEGISMADVYRFSTVERLAERFEGIEPGAKLERAASPNADPDSPLSPGERAGARGKGCSNSEEPQFSTGRETRQQTQVPFWRHFWCGAAQLVSLVFVLTFFALQWLTPYLIYTVMVEEEYGFLEAVLGAFASLILFYPVMLMAPILTKWVVIGRYKPGSYPLWGTYYFRWWLATSIEAAVPVGYLAGTPLMSIYLRLMGAKVGRNVQLSSNNFVIYDLLAIGEDSSVNVDSNLLGYTVENGVFKVGRITIGRRCFVGARAAVGLDTVIEDGGALEDLSFLPSGGRIAPGEVWRGSPASREQGGGAKAGEAGRERGERAGAGRRLVFGVLHGVGLLIFPVLVIAALFPGIVGMNKLNYIDPYYWYLLLAPLAGLSFIVLLCLEIAVVKWVLLGKVEPGSYRVHSFYYLRKWFVDQTMDLSLDVLGSLYASIYLAPWYRLLGARLGKGAEVSTASFISPDLLSIGDESFVADSVSLGAPRVRDGVVTIGNNHIGRRSFIGNSAMLPPGTVIGDSVLIGCLSAPPANPADALKTDSAWLGSPALFLPQRQKSAGFSEETTFRPGRKLRLQRAAIEFVRVITPSTLFIILISLLFSAILLLRDHYTLIQTLLFFPFLYIACGLATVGIMVIAKWALVGRYRPGEQPLWSTFVWRNELLNALHEHLAEPFMVGALTGTPFLCWYFRLLGARIGRRVYMETTDLSEFDLARIGDEAVLNADCTIQTHLFEDRVMKMSTVEIGAGCGVGAGSLVLYDTRMEPGASLGDLSLLMKGEVLPEGTAWQGIPARAGRRKAGG